MLTIMLVSGGYLYWVRLKFTETILASSKKLAKNTILVTDMQSLDADSVEGNAIELAANIKIVEDLDGNIGINVSANAGESTALIKSIKEEGIWKRSTESLWINEETFNFSTNLSTYPVNTSLLLNGGNMPSNILK